MLPRAALVFALFLGGSLLAFGEAVAAGSTLVADRYGRFGGRASHLSEPCAIRDKLVAHLVYVTYLKPKGFETSISDPSTAFNHDTGQNAAWDEKARRWIDVKTGKPLSPSATGKLVAHAVFVTYLEPKGFETSISDPFSAFNHDSGQNAAWDERTWRWIDTKTGKALSPAACSGQASASSRLSISPIRAVFSEPDRATTYSVPTVTDQPGAKISYRWRLKLEAVDPNLGIDPGCNNHGVVGTTTTEFVWHHGNKGDPVHDDGCDHTKQGRYGHQGLVTVVVSDDHGWRCTANYKGTNSSDVSATAGFKAASQPECAHVAP